MTDQNYGPTLPISKEIHEMKYRGEGETFIDAVNRQASTLSDSDAHRKSYSDILLNQRFMPAGRVQTAIGSPRVVTPWNCFVSGTISDSFDDIMDKAKEAGTTMRLGGGIGYDFSTLRPRGERIKSLGSQSSGPVSFMDIYDSICGTIASAGHRRGAQMAVMRVDHPDIMEFIHAKRNSERLTRFNISVGVTDAFIKAVREGTKFPLKWRGRITDKVDARALWDDIMRSTWDWAEPGVLYIDRINEYNNLWYCETIAATNPCQPGWAKVLTPRGIRKLEDISVGDSIWSKEGWTKVINKWSTGIKPVYRYGTTSGVFYGTKNHNVVSNGTKVAVGAASSIDIITGRHRKAVYNPQDVMDGLVLGDGMVHKASNDKVLLCIGQNDEDYFDSEIADKILAYRDGISKYAYEVDTTIDASELPRTFHRRVPDRFKYSPNKATGFLRGLYSANGSVAGNRITLKSSSLGLVEDVQMMLNSLGIRSYYTTNLASTVKFSNGEYECKQSYDLNISTDRELFLESIGFLQQYKNDKIKVVESSRVKTTYDIVDVSYVSTEEVFDITVDNDSHTYWTQGCDVSNCGEQPLPPYGACLLGSFNLVKYVTECGRFDFDKFAADIPHVVRAMDNIIDIGTYPLPAQEEEGKNKRRMGLGITGVANAFEYLGCPYASDRFIAKLEHVLQVLRDETYRASVELAKEKGSFPMFDADKYLQGKFIQTLPFDIRQGIFEHGIRNSHLLSIAPTGTISLSADNVSSGIEPVFTYEYDRTIQTFDGPKLETVPDYGYRVWGVKGRTADEVGVEEHVRVLGVCQEYVDSACSKTCNVGDNVDWERFKDVYMLAFDLGAKGCTTFRAAGKRYGILNKSEAKKEVEYIDDEDAVEACFIDPQTGQPKCS